MSETLFIGIDLGTTGIKVGLFDASGRQAALAARECRLETPAPGFAEFDAEYYVGLAFEAIREVLAAPGIHTNAVKAIGISSQAQTFVLLDGDGRPVRPAVSWLDVRAEDEADEISRAVGEKINAIASAPKVLWLKRHEPQSLNRARRFLVIPDYLIWRMTDRAVSDPSTAASTAAYHIKKKHWKTDVLALCGLEASMMPEVLAPGTVAGRLTPNAAKALGLDAGVLVAVGTNDQTAGAIGAGNVVHGRASLTLGTALALVVSAREGTQPPPGALTGLHPVSGLCVLLAYAKTAGVVLRWFRQNFAPNLTYEQLFKELDTVSPGADGLVCLPHFSGTATPDYNPAARGAFAGLTLAHGRAHMARALVESLAFTIQENAELLAPSVGGLTGLRVVGGGAQSDVWLQMIADVSGIPVERPQVREAACLGAAELAMVAAGRFPNIAEASSRVYSAERHFKPSLASRNTYTDAYRRYRLLREQLYPVRASSTRRKAKE